MASAASADASPSFGWSLPARLVLQALPAALTLFVLLANVVWTIKAVLTLVLGVTLASPAAGLLLVAVVAPLGQLIAPIAAYPDFRITEAIAVAFLAGWLARGLPDRRGPRMAGAVAAGLFAAAVVASIAGLTWRLSAYPETLSSVFDRLEHIYYFVGDPIGVVEGARLIEGLGLAAATVMLFRRRPSLAVTLPLALGASAAIAALSTVLLWRGIGSEAALARYHLIGYRVSGHIGDVNAAGSYYAMTLCLALGMAGYRRGRERVFWLAIAAAISAALWLSGSRSALGAAGALMIVAIVWALTQRFTVTVRRLTFAAAVIVLLIGAVVRARMLETDPDYKGTGFRTQFTQTSARMIRARPLFGVGVGQYNPTSLLFLSPQLAFTYGVENAHNNFLQIGGELGLVGLGLFLLWVGAALTDAARAMARTPHDGRLLGTAGGVTVFLITCLTGHPLLVTEVAYPFWIQFGLMTALAGAALFDDQPVESLASEPRMTRPFWLAAAAAIFILVAGPIATASGELHPPDSQAVNGFYGWETAADGTRFRWTEQFASLFVPADVTLVEIPVRVPVDGRSVKPLGVEVMTLAVAQSRTIVGADWATISVPLPEAFPPTRFKRIDLRIDRLWQPALLIPGSADTRSVGVQVGEPRLVR